MTEKPQRSPGESAPPKYVEEPPAPPSPGGASSSRSPGERGPAPSPLPTGETVPQGPSPSPGETPSETTLLESPPLPGHPLVWDNSQIIPNSWLIIVDTYDWAWDIASQELLKAMPESTGTIVDLTDFGKVNPLHYNVVLVYPWRAMSLMDRLYPQNTVVCVAGGEQLHMLPTFKALCGRFKFYGACNEKIQEKLRQVFPTKNVLHLTHGVNSDFFTPAKTRRRKEFTLGWVGNSVRGIKRYSIVGDIVKQGGFKLRTAGFKKYPHDKMPRYYHSIDALIVTSVFEAHPLVVYEAMSSGLPVVTTDVGDVDRYIIDGVNGFILSRNAHPSEYASSLNRLKKDESFRRRVGEAARQTVIEKLSWGEIVNQYLPLPKLMEAS